MDTGTKLQMIVDALADRRGLDVLVLDLRGVTVVTDYFVISSGSSAINVKAQMEGVQERVRAAGIKGIRPEGVAQSGWLLLDLDDVVVHIFDEEQREFYALDRLWVDAVRVEMEPTATGAAQG